MKIKKHVKLSYLWETLQFFIFNYKTVKLFLIKNNNLYSTENPPFY